MKKTILSLALVLTFYVSHAQNIFPTSGNVGIGTTSPPTYGNYSVLAINGANVSQGGYLSMMTNGTEIGSIVANSQINFQTASGYVTQFYTGSLPTMQIAANGNIGIGVLFPSRKLEIVSGTGIGPLKVQGPSGYMLIDNVGSGESYYQANTLHQFQGASGAPIVTMLSAGKVGIGTITPNAKLDVFGNIKYGSASLGRLDDESGYADIIGGVNAGIKFYTNDGVNQPMVLTNDGNVAIGTTDPQGYKLAVNGNMIAEEVKVKLHANWPDYVFKPTYKLPALSEVQTYINKNQHLPEMPSASEVEKNGVNLGEMVKLQTKKIEELTLYLIEKDKQLINIKQSSQAQIDELKKQVEQLTKIIQKN